MIHRFLSKCIVFALLVSGVGSLEMHFPKPVKAEFEGGGVRASTITTQETIQLEPLLKAEQNPSTQNYKTTNAFLSEVYEADFPFDAVIMNWEQSVPDGTSLELLVRFKTVAGKWSDWQDVHPDIDEKGESLEEDDFSEVEAFISTIRSQFFQYKVLLKSVDGIKTPRFRDIRFHYVDGDYETEGSAISTNTPNARTIPSAASAPAAKLLFGADQLNVISRSEWGADEMWRLNSFFGEEPEEEVDELDPPTEEKSGINGEEPTLENLYPEEFKITKIVEKDEKGNQLYWPLEYAENIKKIIIHHTATTSDLDNPKAAIRAIYYYHTVTRGWGDIGYNYIIDPEGNIYEGRYGGEKVVAGHTSGYNTGSIGIAVLGNYQESDVPYEVLEALATLVGDKADRYNITVDDSSRFRGKWSDNVMGHRDAASTACPGQKLYDLLPTLRKIIQSNLSTSGQDDDPVQEDFAFANVNDYSALVLNPQTTTTISLKLKNIGQQSWNSQTFLVANKNPSAEAILHLKKSEQNKTGIAFIKEKEVKSGDIATFEIQADSYLLGGFQLFEITPIFNGSKKLNSYINLPVYISNPDLTYQLKEIATETSRIRVGESFRVELALQNTGNVTWFNDGAYPLNLGTSSPYNRKSPFLAGEANRYTTLMEKEVLPGSVGHFEFQLSAPKTPGHYVEYLKPLAEGASWLNGEAIRFGMSVYDDRAKAIFYDRSPEQAFAPGEKQSVWIKIENIGDTAWSKEKVSVGKLHHASITVSTPTLDDDLVQPGEVVGILFDITAPTKPGTYSVLLKPRLPSQNLIQRYLYFNFTVDGSLPPVVTTSQSDEETIRIKLGYQESSFGDPVITANGAFSLYLGQEAFLSLEKNDEVTVSQQEGHYNIILSENAWVVDDVPSFVPKNESTIMEIKNYEKIPSWDPTLNDNRFRGTLEVQTIDNSLTVINELSLGDYLKGIAEVSNGDHIEKLRTMSILARSYAKYYLAGGEEKFPEKPYDGSDNPDEFQKYLGYGYEERAPNWVKVVEETTGLVVTYKGELIKTPYFNASPGYTKSAEEVWGWTQTPYLVSVSDLCTADDFSGHGVGLSGCGATLMAEQGKSYQEIIKHYFAGVEVQAL